MSLRFSSMSGLASWFGNVPSTSKHNRVVLHGRRSNNSGATMPATPLPASSTTLNGVIDCSFTNDSTCST